MSLEKKKKDDETKAKKSLTKKKPLKTPVRKLQEEIKQDSSDEIEAIEESEVVSSKKVVYLEIDDEVTVVYDKVKAIKSKHVYIVAPKRSIIFQSIVNLKILSRKAADEGKKIYLITNDKNGIHLGQKVGISVYNKAGSDGKPALFNTELNDERLRITPLRATVNEIEDEAPMRLTERKLSISEILRKSKRGGAIDVTRIDSAEKKKKKKPKFVIVAPNRHALIALVSISLVILLFIVYIALPGATIYITPSATKLEKSVNITLADFNKNKAELDTHPSHMIASFPISTNVNKSIVHSSTGKQFSDRGANASGVITIYNTSGNAWPLIAETRFQTEDGIVFRIKEAINVPAASTSGPGTVEAFVTADQLDANGLIVGEKGNIEPTRFFLPGLKGDSQSKVYAENSAPLTGGVTDYIAFVSDEDLNAAEARLRDELVQSAIEELEIAVKEKADLSGGDITYVLLEGENAIKVGEPILNIDRGISGKEMKEFEVSGEVLVEGVFYDKDAMLEILKSELLLKKSPQKELLSVNDDSTSYRIFEWDQASGKIKLTANIKGIEQYEIDPDLENGAKLLEKIKEHIVGSDIEEAKLYIQNLPEVNKVEIESWPVWSPTVPSIPDNIDFDIRDAVSVE